MFKLISTLLRGRAHDAEQAFADRNAMPLLAQQIRDSAQSIHSARRSVAIAIAQNDDARAPTDKDKLRAAADAAKVKADIEVYKGDHGWTVADSPAYDYDEDDASWDRLLALYSTAL